VEFPFYVVAVAVAASVYTCFMGGANDFANAFGTSIGSRAITMKHAIAIAVVAELAGATFVGGHVTDTVRKGIVDPNLFASDPETLVYGLMAALFAAGLFIQISNLFGLPVSTTHATVGGVIGFGIIAAGFGSVSWGKIGQIVLSWLVSPAFGAVLGYLTFRFIQSRIINAEKPVIASTRFMPWLVGAVTVVIILSLVYKGLRNLSLDIPLAGAVLIALSASIIAAWISRTRLLAPAGAGVLSPVELVEGRFRYLQIITAAYISFAHGANDVANGVGPFAGIWSVYRTGVVSMKTQVPMWILFMGGVAMIAGLAVAGRRVIETVGRKITSITPSRGFAAEFGAATTVLLCTKLGLPVSTTHTLVGAVIGVGLARGIGALDMRVVRGIFASWIVTLPATIVFAMLLYLAFAHFLP